MTTNTSKQSTEQEYQNTLVNEFVTELIPMFEALASESPTKRRNGTASLEGWKSIASRTAKQLMMTYPDSRPEGEKEYASCWSQIGKLKTALDKAATTQVSDRASTNGVKTINKHFINALYQFFGVYRQNTSARYKKEVHTRSLPENRLVLDMSKYLVQAEEVLKATLPDSLVKPKWEQVSCALALVTGRRMAEIHLSGEFEQVENDEYAVLFTGQLKGKTRKASFVDGRLIDGAGSKVRDVGFIIPTLVKSELVVSGMNYLSENGKRLAKTFDTVKVNERYSKALSLEVSNNWQFIEYNAKEHNTDNDSDNKLGTTYHKFRAAYFLMCLVNKNIDAMDALDYITLLLGDTSKDAQDAYKRFKIAPNTTTII